MTNQHNIPITELKKKFNKLISLNTDLKIIEKIKKDINDLTFDIDSILNHNVQCTQYETEKQNYIDSKLQPMVLAFAVTYSLQLAEEYDSIHSLSETSDGTNGS